MNRTNPPRGPLSQRLIVISTAVFSMGIVLLAIQRASAGRDVSASPAPAAIEVDAGNAIATEALVFRTRQGQLALEPDTHRRADAHPRTFGTFRLLRSYPGAPPRVPHGLTATEFRTNRCNTCHERGGFSQRFGAYAPVNPHPEWVACLQCHATNELLVGLPFPQASGDDACRQCHARGPARFEESGLDWRPAAWPPVGVRQVIGVPAIPHDLQTRGNCFSCHMGPGSVAEIRMTHPAWSNCRQCHLVPVLRDGAFVRPAGVPGGDSLR